MDVFERAKDNRKYRENVSRFRSLLTTPAAAGVDVKLPASGRIRCTFRVGVAQGAPLFTKNGEANNAARVYSAGEHIVFDWLERSITLNLQSTVKFELDVTGFGKWQRFAGAA